MSFTPERLSAHQLLTQTILEAHRLAALDTYRVLGLDISEWDTALLSNFQSDLAIDEENAFIVGDIDFDKDTDHQPVHAGVILGYPFFVLHNSYTPQDILDGLRDEKGNFNAIEDVEAPGKLIRVWLLNSADDTNRSATAMVFIAPDMPPTAVHEDDAWYAQERLETDYRSLSILSRVRQLFDDDAVDILSDDTCMAISAAIQESNIKTSQSFSQ